MTEQDNPAIVFSVEEGLEEGELKVVEYPCIIRTDGTIESYLPKNGKDFKLEELKKAIGGGYIEMIQEPERRVLMVIDDEGKLKGFPLNPIATAVWESWYGPTDVIVGDALLCRVEQVE